jgi:predicted metal-dependent peptidase
MNNTLSKDESLTSAIKRLIIKQPYYGLFLSSLQKTWNCDNTIEIKLHSLYYKLDINEEYWMGLSQEDQEKVLMHNIMHVAFFHLVEFTRFKNQDLAALAFDIEVNNYIPDLPENFISINSFPDLNLNPNMGSHYYYEQLDKASENNQNVQDTLEAMQNGDSSIELNGQTVDLPNHDWKEFEDLSEAEQNLLESQTLFFSNELAEQVKKSTGNLPYKINELLNMKNYKEPPKVDWRGFIRMFVTNSIEVYTKLSRRRESKRLHGFPGVVSKQKAHMLVAVDVSGSVTNKELQSFFNEINHIYKSNVEVTVIQCDTAIASIEKYHLNYADSVMITARGGTSFEPVIEYYDENCQKYTCLVYLTDGEAATPPKPRGPVLWVFSECSKINESLPGYKIKMN